MLKSDMFIIDQQRWLCLILRRDGHDVASILYKYAFRDYRRVNYVEIDFNHV